MYRCSDCGCQFDEPREYEECIGEFWGTPAYQRFSVCPECGGDYEEVREE